MEQLLVLMNNKIIWSFGLLVPSLTQSTSAGEKLRGRTLGTILSSIGVLCDFIRHFWSTKALKVSKSLMEIKWTTFFGLQNGP